MQNLAKRPQYLIYMSGKELYMISVKFTAFYKPCVVTAVKEIVSPFPICWCKSNMASGKTTLIFRAFIVIYVVE